MKPEPAFALTDRDRDSDLWRRILAHLNQSLDSLRKQNDSPAGEVETAAIRGRITQLKALIALDKPPLDL